MLPISSSTLPDWQRIIHTPNDSYKIEWLQDAKDKDGNFLLKHGGEYMLLRAIYQRSTGHGSLKKRRHEQRPRWMFVSHHPTSEAALAAALGKPLKLTATEKKVLAVLFAGGHLTAPWTPSSGNFSSSCWMLKEANSRHYSSTRVRKPTIEKMCGRHLLHLDVEYNTQTLRPTFYAEAHYAPKPPPLRQTGRDPVRQGETEERRRGVPPHERAQVVLPSRVRRKAEPVQHDQGRSAVRRTAHQGLDQDQAVPAEVQKLNKKETELVNRLNRGGVLRLCCYGRNTGKYYVRTFAANTYLGYRTFNEAYYSPKFVKALIAKGVLVNRAYKKNHSLRPTEAYKKIKL